MLCTVRENQRKLEVFKENQGNSPKVTQYPNNSVTGYELSWGKR